MARLIFLISLIFALLALNGWLGESSAWIRALMALASIMIGIGFTVLLAPSSEVRRFKSVRKPSALGRVVSVACIAMVFGLFYFILVYAPPATRQFSDLIYAAVTEPVEIPEDKNQEMNFVGSDRDSVDYEINALFDPDGALVPKSANLRSSDEPQVSLKMSDGVAFNKLRDSGQIYLHAFSHHAFDGERWTSQGPEVPNKLTHDRDGLIYLQAPDQAPAYQYTVLHHQVHRRRNTINTLQGVRFVRLPEITQINPGTWLLPPLGINSSRVYEYQAGSSPRQFGELIASGKPIEAGHTDPAYLAAASHANLHFQIQKLAGRFRHHATLEERLVDLQNWLSGSFTHSLSIDYADGGKCALEAFLADPEAKAGFCVHFASAAALMARELGVPSRVSYGWTGGEAYEGHKQFVFRAEDGHAWAEVFLKGHGWVVLETTPSSGLPVSNSAPLGEIPPVAEEQIEEEDSPTTTNEANPAPLWKWTLIALGIGVVVLFMLLFSKQNKLVQSRIDSLTDVVGAPSGYLQIFYQACADLGFPKPVGCTLQEHLEQLDREQISIPFANELLTYHYNVTYREIPRDVRFEKGLRKQIKAL